MDTTIIQLQTHARGLLAAMSLNLISTNKLKNANALKKLHTIHPKQTNASLALRISKLTGMPKFNNVCTVWDPSITMQNFKAVFLAQMAILSTKKPKNAIQSSQPVTVRKFITL